jgi:virulence factor Mce-like protein
MTQHIPPTGRHQSGAPGPASHRRRVHALSYVRPLTGLATIVAILGIAAVALVLFRGGFTPTTPVTVVSPRAGLVMNPDAKVKMRGVQVGKVASIESLPDGQAALHLALEPSQLRLIPSNVSADITSSTVFGAKFVELVAPDQPSPKHLHAGQVLEGKHVTVEINTVFQQLTSVLSKIEPVKLNQTLGAIAAAVNDRGHKIGQMLSDLDSFLATQDPSLPALSHDIEALSTVSNAYADAAPDLVKIADNATRTSQTIVDEQKNLDAFLISTIGLADIGNEVVGGNRQALTDVLHLLVPTTDLTNEYHQALWCGLAGAGVVLKDPPISVPGIPLNIGVELGSERFRYPGNLPKVAATGGPQCDGLPNIPPDVAPPYVITDVGANPFQYGNPQILINSDFLKQLLYGPLDGPPRNTMQYGQYQANG